MPQKRNISDGEEGFFRTGNMHYARSGHSAILLKDGRIFITGRLIVPK